MNTTELARAAGVHPLAMSEEYLPGLERLVALVRADEREACARICEAREFARNAAISIRARGSKE